MGFQALQALIERYVVIQATLIAPTGVNKL